MFVFQYIHMMLSTLFLGDLLKNLGKCVTTLHFSNSSSDCFHTVLNIPSFYHYAIHWFTFHVDGHSLLSSFWIWSFLISPFPFFFFPNMFHLYSLHLFYLSFLSHWLCLFSRDSPNGIRIFWDEGTELISTWLPCSLCFLGNVS